MVLRRLGITNGKAKEAFGHQGCAVWSSEAAWLRCSAQPTSARLRYYQAPSRANVVPPSDNKQRQEGRQMIPMRAWRCERARMDCLVVSARAKWREVVSVRLTLHARSRSPDAGARSLARVAVRAWSVHDVDRAAGRRVYRCGRNRK